jgi:large subunit ribosomal protein L24
MKSEFNKNWNRSVQPRRQRKFLINAPLHIKRKLLSATLDKSLRTKNKRRSIEVRKNDEVVVMSGKFEKKQGKVTKIDVKKTRVQIDGLTIKKKDGEKIPVWFHPSKLKIIKLDDSDNKRLKKKKESENKSETKIKAKEDK